MRLWSGVAQLNVNTGKSRRHNIFVEIMWLDLLKLVGCTRS